MRVLAGNLQRGISEHRKFRYSVPRVGQPFAVVGHGTFVGWSERPKDTRAQTIEPGGCLGTTVLCRPLLVDVHGIEPNQESWKALTSPNGLGSTTWVTLSSFQGLGMPYTGNGEAHGNALTLREMQNFHHWWHMLWNAWTFWGSWNFEPSMPVVKHVDILR